jgi:hypothetical protein
MIQTKAIFSFYLSRRNSRYLGRVELDHLVVCKVIMQYVLFHFKIKPIKPLPTYLRRQGISVPKTMEARDGAEHFSYSDPKPKIKRMMHGPEKIVLGAITSGNWYGRLASMACGH